MLLRRKVLPPANVDLEEIGEHLSQLGEARFEAAALQ
jgi:hypothetical protein